MRLGMKQFTSQEARALMKPMELANRQFCKIQKRKPIDKKAF